MIPDYRNAPAELFVARRGDLANFTLKLMIP